MHDTAHPLAGMTVRLRTDAASFLSGKTIFGGAALKLEDWYDRASGRATWLNHDWTPAELIYGVRIHIAPQLPMDDEVVYGKIGATGVIVHVSELSEVVE